MMKRILTIIILLIGISGYGQSLSTAPYYIGPIDSSVKIPVTIGGSLRNIYPQSLIQQVLDSLAALRGGIVNTNIANADLTMDNDHTMEIGLNLLDFTATIDENSFFQMYLTGRGGGGWVAQYYNAASGGADRFELGPGYAQANHRDYYMTLNDNLAALIWQNHSSTDQVNIMKVAADSIVVAPWSETIPVIFRNLPDATGTGESGIVVDNSTGQVRKGSAGGLADGNNYVTGGEVAGTDLILHRQGLGDVTIDASSLGGTTTETDPVWTAEKAGYYTKPESDGRYLQAETDPTVSTIIKNIPVSADVTTNKYYYWNNGSIARKQIDYSELSGKLPVTATYIPFGGTGGVISTSSSLQYDSANVALNIGGAATDFRLNILTTFDTENGMKVTNTSSGTHAAAAVYGVNDVGTIGGFAVSSSLHGRASAANRTSFISTKGVSIISNSNVSSGGTDDVRIYVGGNAVNPFVFNVNGTITAPDGSTIGSGTGGTTYTFNSSSIVNTASNLALSGDAATPGNNKIYGTNSSGVKGWQSGIGYNLTSLTNWNLLRYNSTTSAFENFTPAYSGAASVVAMGIDTLTGAIVRKTITGSSGATSADSLRTTTSWPATGNIVIRSDLRGGKLYFLSSGYWKASDGVDSFLAVATPTTVTWAYKNANMTEANNGLVKSSGAAQAFDAFARSTETFTAGHYLQFTDGNVTQAYQRIVGFGTQATPTAASQVLFGIYLYSGNSNVYKAESGTYTVIGTYAVGDRFRVNWTASNTIEYQKSSDGTNWTTITTSSGTPSGTYYAIAAFNHLNGAITNVLKL